MLSNGRQGCTLRVLEKCFCTEKAAEKKNNLQRNIKNMDWQLWCILLICYCTYLKDVAESMMWQVN